MAHDTEKLRELLERCEAATGPDRELDLHISRSLGLLGHAAGLPDEAFLAAWLPACRFGRYTASLDASIALVERMLPGWDWLVSLSELGGREFCAVVEHWDGDEYVSHRPTAPLAILSALLRALISQAEGEAKHG